MITQQGYQPWGAGIPTFFRAPLGTSDRLRKGDVAVFGVPFDTSTTLGRPGSAGGPRQVRVESCYYASLHLASQDRATVDLETGEITRLKDSLPLVDLGDVDIYPMSVDQTSQHVIARSRTVSAARALPVVLGGDHYVAYPAFAGFVAGLAPHSPHAKIGYVHIDSHTDLYDSLPYAGRYNHATSARRVSEHEQIDTDRMVWLGINGASVSLEQYEYVKDNNLLLISARNLRGDMWKTHHAEGLERLEDCTHIYISVDIDVLDGTVGPGTGATVFDGLGAMRYLDVLQALARFPTVAAIDCCEVAPKFDPAGRTARLAALGILTLIDRHLFDREPGKPLMQSSKLGRP